MHLHTIPPHKVQKAPQQSVQSYSQCGVEVEGGRVPTRDWFLNLQILTSGGFR